MQIHRWSRKFLLDGLIRNQMQKLEACLLGSNSPLLQRYSCLWMQNWMGILALKWWRCLNILSSQAWWRKEKLLARMIKWKPYLYGNGKLKWLKGKIFQSLMTTTAIADMVKIQVQPLLVNLLIALIINAQDAKLIEYFSW